MSTAVANPVHPFAPQLIISNTLRDTFETKALDNGTKLANLPMWWASIAKCYQTSNFRPPLPEIA
eukprot:4696251-Ditylum_brightwellii.AAC.2